MSVVRQWLHRPRWFTRAFPVVLICAVGLCAALLDMPAASATGSQQPPAPAGGQHEGPSPARPSAPAAVPGTPPREPLQSIVPGGPRTLLQYVDQEQVFLEYLKEHHPIFSVYQKDGRILGTPRISDREEEFVEFGGAPAYLHAQHGATGQSQELAHAAITYRLGEESILDLPNNFVGPRKCGECHPAQYEAWKRSRHALNVRFPDEITEVKDLNAPVYPPSPAAVLPPGITPDAVFAVVGTPRTKYGFLDGWLVRGTYHVVNGIFRDGTGTLVAGGNQFSRSFAHGLTPDVAKRVAGWIPGFPTRMEDFGGQQSANWGTNSYGATYQKGLLFQPASAYCEVCHSFKFDFKSQAELLSALGNPAELRKHTISKGISCEECHGAGAHLLGANSRGAVPSTCERCHQRFAWNEQQAQLAPRRPFTSYFKTSLLSCGTEGSQSYNTKHKDAGMTCSTCHDPHEVTANDWRDPYTVPGLKKRCEDCHAGQAEFFRNRDMHGSSTCPSCHMPVMMSCENFAAIQYPDVAGFDTARTAHIWKIKVDPDYKTLNPPEGKSRDWKEGAWLLTKDQDGRPALDVMWTCGRTSWSDGHLVGGSGCHSPVVSQLPAELHFRNQKDVYERIAAWQTPVRTGLADARTALGVARTALSASSATVAARAQAQLMISQAQQIVEAIERDGSSGVHAPSFTKQKVDEARLLAAGANELVTAEAAAKRH